MPKPLQASATNSNEKVTLRQRARLVRQSSHVETPVKRASIALAPSYLALLKQKKLGVRGVTNNLLKS